MSTEKIYSVAQSIRENPIWKLLDDKNKELARQAEQAAEFVEPHLSCYNILFPHYTDHSIKHSFNVMENMYKLMASPQEHTGIELFFCIYAALFHDVGMILSEKEMDDEIKGITESYISRHVGNGESEDKKKIEREAVLRNKIRTEHGNRVESIMDNWYSDNRALFSLAGNSIISEISMICKSHMQTVEEVQDLLKSETTYGEQYSPLYIAVLLRLADAIDFSPDRAPYAIYNNYNIENDNQSDYHWQMHNGIKGKLALRNNHGIKTIILFPKILNDWLRDNPQKTEDDYQYVLTNVYAYYQWLEQEIKDSIAVLDTFTENKYWITAKMQFSDDPKKFSDYVPNFRIKTNYEAIVANLLGTGLYGEPRVGLREIIQNSIDACRWRACRENGYEAGTQPTIKIIIDEREKDDLGKNKDPEVRIIDNGIGMSLETVKTCFLGIGNSIYNNPAYQLSKEKFNHIGKHGIGFFAAFMLSDKVKIRTRHIDSKDEIKVVVTSWQENALVQRVKNNPIHVGTEIILRDVEKFKEIFKPCCKEEQNTANAVRHYIENVFLNDNPTINFRIKQIGKDGTVIADIMQCDVLPLKEKVESSLGQIEDLTEHFSFTSFDGIEQPSIECFACFDREITKRRLFVWNKEEFSEQADWSSLPEGEVAICTINLFEQGKKENPIVFYVPHNESAIDPFGLVNQRYREKTYYATSKVFSGAPITISDFFSENGILNIKYPFGAFAERVKVKKVLGSVFLLRENAEFEDSTPKTRYVRSGKSYFDKVYARNVIVPKAHLRAPIRIIAIDGNFSGELKDIIVNIKSNKIYPTLKRDNLSDEDIENVSYSVARALMVRQIKEYDNLKNALDYIIEQFFDKKNIFIKE